MYPKHTLTARDEAYSWLTVWMNNNDLVLWGVADLQGLGAPNDAKGRAYPLAVSLAVPMDPRVMSSVRDGPNQAYANEYARVNKQITQLSTQLAKAMQNRGAGAQALAASSRTDPVQIRGDFPHKTAATRSGLGWIGRNCQLISRPFGPWVRLGTVFTHMDLPAGKPQEKSFCGRCMRCVEACPAGALQGNTWSPQTPRQDLLDVLACDAWKKRHYAAFHNGHNCGICASVCPYGLKTLSKNQK
ncbi:MAG: 4Fe-4S double cluster binding domain-containing protein [Desulfovermiculus sp.]